MEYDKLDLRFSKFPLIKNSKYCLDENFVIVELFKFSYDISIQKNVWYSNWIVDHFQTVQICYLIKIVLHHTLLDWNNC